MHDIVYTCIYYIISLPLSLARPPTDLNNTSMFVLISYIYVWLPLPSYVATHAIVVYVHKCPYIQAFGYNIVIMYMDTTALLLYGI